MKIILIIIAIVIAAGFVVGSWGGSVVAPTHDLIKVTSPLVGTTVTSPLVITGEARGNWFFEASFPIKLLDANGTMIATGFAQAEGDWMTEEFVPFRSEIQFMAPLTSSGTIVLEKDNPSGLPENDDSFVWPIEF